MNCGILIPSILLGIIHLSSGLQEGLEYDYKYYGHAWVGIPEIRRQAAATAIKADVTIQVFGLNNVIAKMSNVMVGDMNGDMGCKSDGSSSFEELPITNWLPIPAMKELLERPFRFSLDIKWKKIATEHFFMEVAKNEPHWVTDLRKGLVTTFRVQPIQSNFKNFKKPIFTFGNVGPFFEETIFGHCQTWFDMHQQMDVLKMEHDVEMTEKIKEDIQPLSRNNRSEFALEDRLWKMTHTQSFASCKEFVKVRNLALMVECNERPYQCNRDENGRSSTGWYWLRGGPSGVRLEKAEVEDVAILHPYAMSDDGRHTEQIRANANKKLQLVAVRAMERAMTPITGSIVSNPQFELVSPKPRGATTANRQVSFTEMMTGIQVDPNMIAEIKERMIKNTILINTWLNAADEADVVNVFDQMAEDVNFLELEDLEEIHLRLKSDTSQQGVVIWKLWMKIVMTSGSAHSHKFIVPKLTNGEFGRDLKLAFYMNLSSNHQSIDFFSELLYWCMGNEGTDDVINIICLNELSIAGNICIQPVHQVGLTDPSCGHQHCDANIIDKVFLPFLDRGMRNESLSHWLRVMYMNTITNLRSNYKHNILRPYVLGEVTKDKILRMSAIAGHSIYRTPPEVREQTIDMLLATLTDQSEEFQVRLCSFLISTTWLPRPAWYHAMVLQTWTEPNRQLAGMMSHAFYLKSITDRRQQWLNSMVRLTKPAPPSGSGTSGLRDYYYQIFTQLELSWQNIMNIARNDGIFPTRTTQFYQAMRVSNWFPSTTLNRYVTIDYFHTHDTWQAMRHYFWGTYPKKEKDSDPAVKVVKGIYDQMQDFLGNKPDSYYKYGTWYLYHKWQRAFEVTTPVTLSGDDVINFPRLVKSLPKKLRIDESVWSNYGKVAMGFPTCIGIPVIFIATSPSYASISGDFKMNKAVNEPTGSRLQWELDATMRMTFQTKVTARAILPWNNKAIVAGIDTYQKFVFPFKLECMWETVDSNDVAVRTSFRDPRASITMLEAVNTPFTVRADVCPTPNLASLRDYKPIHKQRQEYKEHVWKIPEVTGLKLKSVQTNYAGPMYDLFPSPHPTKELQYWSWRVYLDPATSETTSVEIGFSYARPFETLESKHWGATDDIVDSFVNFGRSEVFVSHPHIFWDTPDTAIYHFNKTTNSDIKFKDLWPMAPYSITHAKEFDTARHKLTGYSFGATGIYKPKGDKPNLGKTYKDTEMLEGKNRGNTPVVSEKLQESFNPKMKVEVNPEKLLSSLKSKSFTSQKMMSPERLNYLNNKQEEGKQYRTPLKSRFFSEFKPQKDAAHTSDLSDKFEENEDNSTSGMSLMDYDDYFNDVSDYSHKRVRRMAPMQDSWPFHENSDLSTLLMSFIFYGRRKRHFELDLTWEAGGKNAMYGSKVTSTLTTVIGEMEPYVMCVNVESQWPWLFPITTIEEFVKMSREGKSHTFNIRLYTGQNCATPDAEPKATVKGELSLTDKGINYINIGVQKMVRESMCPHNPDTSSYYLKHRFYDYAKIEANWKGDFDVLLKNWTYYCMDTMSGFHAANVYKNHMARNTRNQATLVGRRRVTHSVWRYDHDRNNWDVEVKLPTIDATVRDIELHFMMEDMIAPYPLWAFNNDEYNKGGEVGICRVMQNQIRSLDGTFIWAGPNECWTVLSRDCTLTEEWMILVRDNRGEMVVKVLWPDFGMIVVMTTNAISINDEVIDFEDQLFGYGYKIWRRYNGMHFWFGDGHYLRALSDRIEFQPSKMGQNRICGICGQLNDNLIDDMEGPMKCIYTDAKLFVLAWTVPSCFICNMWELVQLKAPVIEYQKTCKKMEFKTVAEHGVQVMEPCTDWFYEKRQVGDFTCTATSPSPSCLPGCKSLSTRPLKGASGKCASGDVPIAELAAGPLAGPWTFRTSAFRPADTSCNEFDIEYQCIKGNESTTDHSCNTHIYYTSIPTYVQSSCFMEGQSLGQGMEGHQNNA